MYFGILEAIPEPLVAGFKQRVQEVWKDLKDNLQEKAKAIWNNPKVKEVVEKGEKVAEEAKKALRDVVENVRNEIDRISKEVEQIKDNVDTTSLKDKVQQAWNDFKKKVEEKSEEVKNNPNVKEIIEATDKAIEDAKGNVKAIIDAVQQAIDSISKEAEKVKKNADTTSLKDKVEQAWNDFKKKVEEKSEEVKNNPKVKEIIEATDKAIEDAKGNFKAIIDAVQKAIDSVSKEAEKVKKNADTTSLKDKVEQAWNDFKKKVEEKSEEVKNNPKVKEIIEATDKAIEDAKGDVKAIIDAVHKAIESISKEAEQIKDNVDTISWKEKIVKTWEDFKKKVEEKSEEVKNNPKVKEIIEATDKAIEDAKGDVKAIIDAVHKAIESISKEGEKVEENADATSWKEKVKGAWNDFKKKVDQKSEEIKNNPKVKEIIEATDKAIENAKGEAKEIVDAVHKAIDNISIRSYEVLAEPAGHDSVKEKLEKAWNNFKKIIADKVDEIIRDPKTKEILDKSEKVINEAHENAKNIIESIRKAADESSKNTDENSAKSVANIYVSNVKEAWESFKRKIAATYNNVWEKQKVKTAIDDGERTLLRIQDSAQDVVDAIRRELEKSHDNSQ
ncbi:PREDICTED: intracellular protein transport protein USO1-like [Polistes dominula]|uniref:Intracellular protein transport protein USO1-like n=1 Tax=Polistes dominula TaxID=743375 RepID=A0ABM1J3S2_POLDO|nr:PREDICTED: intracellular protein transport protein USO1-like [Polistes dominula]